MASKSGKTWLLLCIIVLFFWSTSFRKQGYLPAAIQKVGLSRQCAEEDYSCKVRHAQAYFATFSERQSSDPEEAVREYRRRYSREPPVGFKDWVQFALDHNSTVIDDFDQLDLDLKPFRTQQLSAVQILARIASVQANAEPPVMGALSVKGGKPVAFGPLRGSMSAGTLEDIIRPIAHKLPDVGIPFNFFCEPRIMAATNLAKGEKTESYDDVQFFDWTGNSTLSPISALCPINTVQGFKSGTGIDRDFCDADWSSLKEQHGFFVAPDNFRPTRSLVPLLSRAKMSTFSDIVVPNPCYYAQSAYSTGIDPIDFEDKKNSLYWRGSSTGMHQTPDTWGKGQRHRFVRYMMLLREAISLGKSSSLLDPLSLKNFPSNYKSSAGGNTLKEIDISQRASLLSSFSTETFDVAFTRLRGGEEPLLNEMGEHLPVAPLDPKEESFKHRFVADIDGQSMSCRFYRLLGGNSVVLKQTIWTEWHDERLVPWLHYIPIGLDLDTHEIPKILRYLMFDKQGERDAKLIASASREQRERSLRSIDITIYYYRVLLEFAALVH